MVLASVDREYHTWVQSNWYVDISAQLFYGPKNMDDCVCLKNITVALQMQVQWVNAIEIEMCVKKRMSLLPKDQKDLFQNVIVFIWHATKVLAVEMETLWDNCTLFICFLF